MNPIGKHLLVYPFQYSFIILEDEREHDIYKELEVDFSGMRLKTVATDVRHVRQLYKGWGVDNLADHI